MRKVARLSGILLFVIIFSASLFLTVFTLIPQKAQAAISEQEIAYYEAFNQFLASCEYMPLDYVTVDQWDGKSGSIAQKHGMEISGVVNVSAKSDRLAGGDGSGELRCETIIKDIATEVYGSRRKMLEAMFDTTKRDGGYDIRGHQDPDCNNVAICTDKERSKFMGRVDDWLQSIRSGNEERFEIYAKQVIQAAFNSCFAWDDPANPRNDSNKYNRDSYKKNHDNIAVGMLGESYVENYNDGKVSCENVFTTTKNDDLLDYDPGNDQQDIVDAEKKEDILGIFLNQGPDILHACVGANNSGSFREESTLSLMEIMASWLANGATGEIRYAPAGSGGRMSSVNAAEAAKIAACLTENYGESLQEILDQEPSDFNPDTENQPGSIADKPTCESEGGALGWILCKVLEFGDTVMGGLDSAVNNILEVPDAFITDPDIEKAFASMRNIAYTILVPMALVMVISTALGFEFISAYTIKRALPRMVIATIFIALSFNIVTFLVTATNNVGTGISGIIEGALGGGEVNLVTVFNPPAAGSAAANAGQVAGAGVGLVAIVTGGALGIMAIGSLGILLSYVLVALVALFMAFFLLSLRQALIVFLMIMAPVAILSWIFPGNDKLWKLWWSTFSKLLLLYPLIMVLIATGKGFAQIAPGEGLVDTFIRVVAYFGPYFLIPSMFKFAGGAFATISGMANNRSKGLFDRNKKYRGQKMSQNWKDTKGGNRYSERNRLARGFNRMGMGVGVGSKGHYGLGERGRQALDLKAQANADDALKNNPELQKLAFNDDGNAVMALSGGSRAGAEQAARELFTDDNGVYDEARAQRAINAAAGVGFNRSNAQAALTTMAQNKSRAIAAGQQGREQVQAGINRLAAGNSQHATSLRDNFAYQSFSNGRADLGATSWNSPTATRGGFDRSGANAVANGHVNGVRATGQWEADNFRAAMMAGDHEEALQSASRLTALRNGMGAHTPEENKQAINEILQSAGVDLYGQSSVDEQFGNIIAGPVPQGAIPPRPAPLGSSYSAAEKATYDAQLEAYQAAMANLPSHAVTEAIRNRAGAYDQGTGRRFDPAQQQQQQQQQQGPQPGAGGGGNSDRRLKQNVRIVGSAHNITLYSFNYFWDNSVTYVGVMAQDLIDTHPEALSIDAWGFYHVNYTALGLRMITIEQYAESPDSVFAKKPLDNIGY